MKFYTLPPFDIYWPNILVNGNNPSLGVKYLRRWGRKVEMVIIDSGVEIFRKPQSKRLSAWTYQTHVNHLPSGQTALPKL